MKRILWWSAVVVCLLFASPVRAVSTFFWDLNGTVDGAGGQNPNGFWHGNETTTGSIDTPPVDQDVVDDNWKTLPPDVLLQYENLRAQYYAANPPVYSWYINKFMWSSFRYEPVYGQFVDNAFSDVVFSNGSDAKGNYTVTVAGSRKLRQLHFRNGTVTLDGGILNFAHVNTEGGPDGGIIRVDNGLTAIIKTLAVMRDNGSGTNADGSLFVAINKIDRGTLIMASTNYHKGIIRVEGGVLQLGTNQVFDLASPLELAYGGKNEILNTPATFKPAGYSQSFAYLRLAGPQSSIDFSDGNGAVAFAASGSQDWNGHYLTIRSFSAGDTLRFGTDANGLGDNLKYIEFADTPSPGNNAPAKIDAQGYVTPNLDAPIIKTHPKGATVGKGLATSLTVEATGTGTLSYRWIFRGGLLPGQTNATLQINPFLEENEGEYRALVSNAAGSTRSAAAALLITAPPVVAPKLLKPSRDKQKITVTWEATPYQKYIVLASLTLGDSAEWLPISEEVTPTSSIGSFVDELEPGENMIFYQVVLLEE